MSLPRETAAPYQTWLMQSEWSIRAAQGRERVADERPFWLRASTAEFHAKASTWERQQIEPVLADMAGMITHVQAQQEARGRGDGRWWASVSKVRADVVAKKRLLGNILARKTPPMQTYKERLTAIKAAREVAANGNPQAAVLMLCDLLIRLWDKDAKP